MGKYSVSPTHKRIFNKTTAVALVAGMSFGGVTAPQIAGAQEMTAATSTSEAGKISPTSPFPEIKETMFDREYKLADAKPGTRTAMRMLVSPTDI